ncbi:SDR family oxidoreductase [Candidatus Pacearchaeota archaeon]|nr:SDR family oxidoreductase [Candidatus Pacearchaeota archaeon]
MKKSKLENTLVTGGAGFIGSHLVDYLLKEDYKVTVIDNFSSGRIENLAQHKKNKNLRIVNSDVADFNKIKKYFNGIDYVFHLAALADLVPSIKNPLSYHHSNVEGTISVLEASRINNVKRFIYAASSSCYGIPDKYPTPEKSPTNPQCPYALTKYLAEQYVMHWNKVYDLPSLSLRMFNVYGPKSRTSGAYGAVFGVFLAQKIAGKPFTIVGDGNQTRDFVFVSDVVKAYILSAKSDLKGEIFNVGCGESQSINKLANLLGGKKKIYIPKRPGEPDRTLADITQIKKKIGWQPKISFEEGVKIMLNNIDYWKTAPVWNENSIYKATKDWFKYLDKK